MTNTNTTHNPYAATLARIAALEAQLQDQEPQDARPSRTVADPDWNAQLAEIAADLERIESKLDAPKATHDCGRFMDWYCPHCGGSDTHTTHDGELMVCHECGAVTHVEDTDERLVERVGADEGEDEPWVDEGQPTEEEWAAMDLSNVARTYTALVQGGWDFMDLGAIAQDIASFTTCRDLRKALKGLGAVGYSRLNKAALAGRLALELALAMA